MHAKSDLPIPKFWMVYREDSSAPRVKHSSLADAANEARRLAKKHPGKAFFVLEAQMMAYGTATVETNLEFLD